VRWRAAPYSVSLMKAERESVSFLRYAAARRVPGKQLSARQRVTAAQSAGCGCWSGELATGSAEIVQRLLAGRGRLSSFAVIKASPVCQMTKGATPQDHNPPRNDGFDLTAGLGYGGATVHWNRRLLQTFRTLTWRLKNALRSPPKTTYRHWIYARSRAPRRRKHVSFHRL